MRGRGGGNRHAESRDPGGASTSARRTLRDKVRTERYVPRMVRHGFRATVPLLVLATMLSGSSCAGDPPSLSTPPTQMIPSAGVPRSSGITVTPEQLSISDPCGLLSPPALSGFGRVSIEPGSQFTTCQGAISLADGGTASVSSEFAFRPHEGASLTPVDRNGVTVYDAPGDSNGCSRYIVVSDHATITVTAGLARRPDLLCDIANAAIDGMLPQLVRGGLQPADLPADSLGEQDACRLFDHTEIRRMTGIDARQVHPAFNGQGCEWNTGTERGPSVLVSFRRTTQPKIDERTDRAITIDGRTAIADPWVGGALKLPSCEVQLVHPPLDRPTSVREVEQLSVSVYTEAPEESNCVPAIELTSAALGRLPRG
ncbi:hypothetical protein ACFHW0_26270 [Micromonospora sp. LOL_025]|uniref:hypothetical protein n=1 Tax=Micromonospora sp. LOL_025 TaxID=3345413 RepID=UPI003A8B937B